MSDKDETQNKGDDAERTPAEVMARQTAIDASTFHARQYPDVETGDADAEMAKTAQHQLKDQDTAAEKLAIASTKAAEASRANAISTPTVSPGKRASRR